MTHTIPTRPPDLPTPVGFVGLGRAGSALARVLHAAGVVMGGAVSRSAGGRQQADRLGIPVLSLPELLEACRLIVFAVPDDALGPVVAATAAHRSGEAPCHLVHLSAIAGHEVFAPARGEHDLAVAVHPLQTLNSTTDATALAGAVAAVGAGDEASRSLGHRFAAALGMLPFDLPESGRPLYHAAAVFAANFPQVLLATAQDLARAAGMPDDLITPGLTALAQEAVHASGQLGPESALTGPVVRGDVGTIRSHLEALSKHDVDAARMYYLLTRAGLQVVAGRGSVSASSRAALDRVLEEFE